MIDVVVLVLAAALVVYGGWRFTVGWVSAERRIAALIAADAVCHEAETGEDL